MIEYNEMRRYGTMEYFGKLSEKYLQDQAGKGKRCHKEEENYARDMVDNEFEGEEELFNSEEEEDSVPEEEEDEENRQRFVEDGRDGWENTAHRTLTETFAKTEVFNEQYFHSRGVRKDGTVPPTRFLAPSSRCQIVNKVRKNESVDLERNTKF
jgi:hypothetical protein